MEFVDIRLDELLPSDSITIRAELGDKRLDLPVELTEISIEELTQLQEKFTDMDFCAINPVTADFEDEDTKVLFYDSNAALSAFVVRDGRPVRWVNIQILTAELLNHRKVLLIVSPAGKPSYYNRRGAVRVFCGADGIVKLQSGDKFPTLIKDLSLTGIGMICSKEHKINIGDNLIVKFIDEGINNTKLVIPASCVRYQDVGPNEMLYGCRVHPNYQAMLAKYINQKQLKTMQ